MAYRYCHYHNLGGFWWDLLLILPIAIFLTHTGATPYVKFLEFPSLFFVVIGLGLLSAIGLGSYILASRYLPLIIFGLLFYLFNLSIVYIQLVCLLLIIFGLVFYLINLSIVYIQLVCLLLINSLKLSFFLGIHHGRNEMYQISLRSRSLQWRCQGIAFMVYGSMV